MQWDFIYYYFVERDLERFSINGFFAPIFKQNLKKRKHDAESGRELDALQGVFIFRQEKDN